MRISILNLSQFQLDVNHIDHVNSYWFYVVLYTVSLQKFLWNVIQ